jgi:hypothetical protein
LKSCNGRTQYEFTLYTLLECESVGQLAVDFTDAQRKLAERAIEEAMQDILEAQPPPQNGNAKPTKLRPIELAEFFSICEIFYDTTPEVKVSAT